MQYHHRYSSYVVTKSPPVRYMDRTGWTSCRCCHCQQTLQECDMLKRCPAAVGAHAYGVECTMHILFCSITWFSMFNLYCALHTGVNNYKKICEDVGRPQRGWQRSEMKEWFQTLLTFTKSTCSVLRGTSHVQFGASTWPWNTAHILFDIQLCLSIPSDQSVSWLMGFREDKHYQAAPLTRWLVRLSSVTDVC